MLGDGWADALQRLADAAEAGGASLVRMRAGRAIAHLSSRDWHDAEAEMLAGQFPQSGLRFYPPQVYGSGFRADHEVWSRETLQRDPYYQEFLRPRRVFFHAKLQLYDEPGGRIALTLKRRIELGPYEPAELACLDAVVPELHAAFRVGRRVLDAEASGMVRVLHQRGDPVLELDASGHVLRTHGSNTEDLGIIVRQRRIIAADRLAQPAIERAVAAALGTAAQPALIAVANRRGERHFLHVVPVVGGARDVFLAAAAMVVVVAPGRRENGPQPSALRQALGLTARETQIAALLAEGLGLPDIADRLHLGIGTVRNHVKSIFSKTDTRRQGELIALLHSLRP